MAARLHPDARQARFVFRGTVTELRAATMASYPVDARTVVVRVDEVFYTPPLLAESVGRPITVQIVRGRVRAGQEAVFYTNPTTFGTSVSVEALDHHDVPLARARVARATPAIDPVTNLVYRDIKDRFDGAKLVVSGMVTTVRLPAAPRRATRAAAEAFGEHDPCWREAVIAVDAVHKGTYSKKTITLRFPSSKDVRWFRSPKLEPAQEGFFILRGERRAGVFTALHPLDVHPYDDSDGIRRLLPGYAETVTR